MSDILIVDDIEANRDVLARRLKGGGDFNIFTAVDGQDAMEKIQEQSFDLILLDIQMPRMDGFQVLEALKGSDQWRHIPVIVISALDDIESVVRCIELGAEDYLNKPFNKTLLKARVGACLERKRLHDQEQEHLSLIESYNVRLEEMVQEQIGETISAQHASILAMSKLAESKDPETGAHLDRMREYCAILAEALQGKDRYQALIDKKYIETIHAASPLHDIGKVGIPDAVLLKPGSLTDEEWEIMRTHPLIGADTLRTVDRKHPGNALIEMGIEIAESHHEKWDGSGYPRGLKGEDIPLSARILALGDVYDALTSRRCYKEAFSHEKARSIIEEGSGSHFDPEVVEAFLQKEAEFIRVRSEYHDEEEDMPAARHTRKAV